MTKKRPRSLNSTDSSSSEETGPSKPPKDVLGLGKYLARELGYEDRGGTLERWMAHHLAELIDEAENGATAGKRSTAQKRATETILKIWEHRLSLPGEVHPLAQYKNILQVLDRLRLDNNPYRFYRHDYKDKKDQLAAVLFDNFTRLILALLLMKAHSLEEQKVVDGVVIEALSDEEQRVLSAIQEWFAIFPETSEASGRSRKSKKTDNAPKIDLNEAAVRLIDGITTTLVKLRAEIQLPDKPTSPPADPTDEEEA
jgi:hypothetical protein